MLSGAMPWHIAALRSLLCQRGVKLNLILPLQCPVVLGSAPAILNSVLPCLGDATHGDASPLLNCAMPVLYFTLLCRVLLCQCHAKPHSAEPRHRQTTLRPAARCCAYATPCIALPVPHVLRLASPTQHLADSSLPTQNCVMLFKAPAVPLLAMTCLC